MSAVRERTRVYCRGGEGITEQQDRLYEGGG